MAPQTSSINRYLRNGGRGISVQHASAKWYMRFLFFFFFFSSSNRTRSGDFYRQYEYALREILSFFLSLSLSTFSKRGTKRFAKCEICIGDYGWSGSSGKSCLAALSALPSSDIDHRHSRKFRCNRKYLYTVISSRVCILFDICPFIILISEIYYRDFVATNVLLDARFQLGMNIKINFRYRNRYS